jgi:hypothetical protein
MDNNIVSSSPPPQNSEIQPSVSADSKCCMTDFVIECNASDVKYSSLNVVGITILGLKNHNGDTLHLEKSSSTTWNSKGVIELPAMGNELTFVAQSEGGDVGFVCLTQAELGDFRTSTRLDKRVKRNFCLTEADSPMLTLSFEICVIPPDENTTKEHNRDQSELVDEATTALRFGNAEVLLPLLIELSDDRPEKPHLLNHCGDLFLAHFHSTQNINDIDNSILAHDLAVQLTPIDKPKFADFLYDATVPVLERFFRRGNLADIDQAISMFEMVVGATPEGHENMPDRLNHLGISLEVRFTRTDDPTDISKAILAQQKAVHLTPEGHAGGI